MKHRSIDRFRFPSIWNADISDRSIRLKWSAIEPPYKFKVRYWIAGAHFNSYKMIIASSREMVLSELKPESLYVFEVVAVDADGRESESAELQCLTETILEDFE